MNRKKVCGTQKKRRSVGSRQKGHKVVYRAEKSRLDTKKKKQSGAHKKKKRKHRRCVA